MIRVLAIHRHSNNNLHRRQAEIVMMKFINRIQVMSLNDSVVVIHWLS